MIFERNNTAFSLWMGRESICAVAIIGNKQLMNSRIKEKLKELKYSLSFAFAFIA
jgi:hypothetical protein